MTKRSCLYLLVSLAIAACTNNVKNRTVVMIDSTYAASFRSNELRMKYMSDEGKPNVILLANVSDKIVINAHRQHIELAFQNNNTLTQYFFIKQGDSILATEWQNNIGIKILNRSCLPFDENYKTKYNGTPQGTARSVDDFYRACVLINDTRPFDWSKDAEINKDLLALKNKALRSLPVENKFIDSLTHHQLISPEVATFYKFKNAFDSIKINHYRGSKPLNASVTWAAPFKALSQNTTPGDFTWIHFTFYDDWLDAYSKQLHPGQATIRNPGALYDSLRRVSKP